MKKASEEKDGQSEVKTSKEIVEEFKKDKKEQSNSINNFRFAVFIFGIITLISFVLYLVELVNSENSLGTLLVVLIMGAFTNMYAVIYKCSTTNKIRFGDFAGLSLCLALLALINLHWSAVTPDVLTVEVQYKVESYSVEDGELVYSDGTTGLIGADGGPGLSKENVRLHIGEVEQGGDNYVLETTIYLSRDTWYAHQQDIVSSSYELYIQTPNEVENIGSNENTLNGEEMQIITEGSSISENSLDETMENEATESDATESDTEASTSEEETVTE